MQITRFSFKGMLKKYALSSSEKPVGFRTMIMFGSSSAIIGSRATSAKDKRISKGSPSLQMHYRVASSTGAWLSHRNEYKPAEITFPADQYLDLLNSSRHILALKHNWDGEGALPFQKATFDKAFELLIGFARYAFDQYTMTLPLPRVLPGPEGSVDLHWKTQNYEFLLNVPAEGTFSTYYGNNARGEEVNGKLLVSNLGRNHGLFLWLDQQ